MVTIEGEQGAGKTKAADAIQSALHQAGFHVTFKDGDEGWSQPFGHSKKQPAFVCVRQAKAGRAVWAGAEHARDFLDTKTVRPK